jgi:signal transduction histidine kinase
MLDRIASRRLPLALAAAAGCLFLAVAASPPGEFQAPQFPDNPFAAGIAPGVFLPKGTGGWQALLVMAVPAAMTAVSLCLLRWWPHLLAAAGLMAVPGVIFEWNLPIRLPLVLEYAATLMPTAGYILAIVALLACAQGRSCTSVAWSAVIVALAVGSRLMGSAMTAGFSWDHPAVWHTALLAAGLAGLAPAAWLYRKGDPAAVGPPGSRPWPRVRLIVTGTLAVLVPVMLAVLTIPRMASLLGTTWDTLYRHDDAYWDVIGVAALAAVTALAVLAGRWALAGALTASVAQVAAVLPVTVALGALAGDDLPRWVAALAGAGLGAVAAGVRWRVPVAAALAVLAALMLFVGYAATTGEPANLVGQQDMVPTMLVIILCGAVGGAVTGATAPVLGVQGALPAALGPLAGVLVAGWLQAVQVTDTFGAVSQYDVIPAAVLLLVAAAAISGLGFAQLLAARSAERKHAEQIRRDAATAERERLGRSIHDGVLQVLALVQREGSELGTHGSELAALAGEQEAALRSLLAGTAGTTTGSTAGSTAGDPRGSTGRPRQRRRTRRRRPPRT